MAKALNAAKLRQLSARTLAHYEASADAFEQGTRHHDVSQNVAAMLGAIEAQPPFRLLDFGCGPGRDRAYFRSCGHDAVGLDGSARFVEMARAKTGCEVMHQDFLELSLPAARYHGIFANASLFHVPKRNPRNLELVRHGGRVRRGRTLLSPGWTPAKRAAVARDGVASRLARLLHLLDRWGADATWPTPPGVHSSDRRTRAPRPPRHTNRPESPFPRAPATRARSDLYPK